MKPPAFWQSKGLLAQAMRPFAALYQGAASIKAAFGKSHEVSVPVVCLGNVTLGGVGKTAVGTWMVDALLAEDIDVHVLLRGYGGSIKQTTQVNIQQHSANEVGDEALLYAEKTPTWIGGDRAKSAEAAIHAGAKLLLMDDGLQNPGLTKDLSILIVDPVQGFGNGYTFPAGPLREPVDKAMSRCQAMIVMQAETQPASTKALPSEVLPREMPTFQLSITATPPPLPSNDVVAFAGIGRPEKFFNSLKAQGLNLVHSKAFADHHLFREEELRRLQKVANGRPLLTTTKDHARLTLDWKQRVTAVDIEIGGEREELLAFITKKLAL